MRAKDLRKYKTLDITELSGSPWNDAEKVLGLDQDDKVIMAEPDAVVTPEDVDEAISQAMEAETARTEDTYAKKSEVPDLDDYYTKEEVDEAISGITVDLSDYYTKDETDQAISAATQDLASTDYVDDAIAAIPEPDLSDYYTKGETDGAISTALVPYATKGWVSSQSYANQNYVMFKVNEAMQIETARTESTYAKKSEIPDLGDYYTKDEVDEAIANVDVSDQLENYALTSSVTQDIQTAIANETGRTESVYAKKSEIPSLDNYYNKDQVDAEITGATEGLASEQYVDDAIAAIPQVDLSGYAKTTAVTQDIQTAMAAETARTESTYLKEHQSLDNYYTKSEVDADFVSAATAVGEAIDAAVDGLASEDYVDNAVSGLASEDYVNNAVTAATENLASESYVDAAITSATQNLATEEYVDDAIATAITIDDQLSTGSTNPVQNQVITNALDNKASKANVDANTNARYFPQWNSDGIIIGKFGNIVYNVGHNINGLTYYILRDKNSGALPTIYAPTSAGTQGQVLISSGDGEPVWSNNNFVTSGDVANQIDTAIANETARTESTYLKEHQSLADYSTTSEVEGMIASAKSEVEAEIPVNVSDLANDTGYITSADSTFNQFFDDVQYDSTTKRINFYNRNDSIVGYVDATSFIKDGMVDNVYITGSTLVISFNTDAGQEDIEIALTDIFDPANYYDKTDVDNMFASETARTDGAYVKVSVMPTFIGNIEVNGEGDATGMRRNIVKFVRYNSSTGEWAGYSNSLLYFSLINGQSIVNNNALGIDNIILPTFNDVATAITEAIENETGRTESTYAKKTEIPSLDDYWTSAQTQSAITAATQGMVTSGDVATQIGTAMAAETARTESTYLKEHQSLDNYYTKSEVDAAFVSAATSVGNAIDAAVDGLASEDYVNNAVSGLASEDYVDNAVTSATEGLATQEYVDNAVAGIDFPDDYATTGDVASAVEGLASESYVNDAVTSATEGMATQSDLEGLASESYVDDAVNGVVQGIGMLGMVNDVSESNGTVTVQKTTMQEGQLVTGSTSFNIATPGDIQTAIASETARTESTYLKEHQSLDNYYTKSQVDAEITGATEDMATKTWVGQQGYLTQHQDLSAYAKTTAVTEDIASAMAAETARTENTYAKPSQIPSLAGYASETYVDNAIASETARTESTYLKEHQDISGKLDKTDFNTYTGATATVLAGKLDTTAYTQGMAAETARTESTYAKPSQIPSLTGYATEQWVEEQGYLTQHQDISGKLDKTDFNTYTGATQTILAGKADVGDIPTVPTNVSAFTNDAGYLTQHQSLAEYYTKTEIDGMIGDIESLLASI